MGKPQFAAVPNRALWDRRLTDRDVRNLAVVASHDRLSSATGKGQGAWASHARMSTLAGTEYSRFSVSINRLLALGYLERQPLATDKRKFTYRVLYNEDDRLPDGKLMPDKIVCSVVNNDGEIVCSDDQLNACEKTEAAAQYISLSEEINSAEAGKINSPEGARFAARGLGKIEFGENVGAQLAVLERALKAGEAINVVAWYEYVGKAWDHEEHRGRATRLADELMALMSEEEIERCSVF
jgi:hypothetical protein